MFACKAAALFAPAVGQDLFLAARSTQPPVEWWLSDQAGSSKLAPQAPLSWTASAWLDGVAEVRVDTTERYQTIYGIGTSLEASTAYNLQCLDLATQQRLMRELFDPDEGIGFNLGRITVGTSDFTPPPYYSYNDLDDPKATDEDMVHFSVERDEDFVLPAIRGALAASVNSGAPAEDGLRLFASPWSAPAWMKDSGRLETGKLLPEHRESFARYLLRFLDAYEKKGVHVDAMTIQNEPMVENPAYPTMSLPAVEEGEVILALNRLFETEKTGLDRLPSVWVLDHNYDFTAYIETLLANEKYSKYVEGSAFHHYGGQPLAMSLIHGQFPDKSVYFTEGSSFHADGARHIIEILSNWARTYMVWVTMLDTEKKPNAGPFTAGTTMLVYDSARNAVERSFEYYMYGQFSKFIRRGAVRVKTIGDNLASAISHIAFVNGPQVGGRGNAEATVVVVANTGPLPQRVRLRCSSSVSSVAKMPPHSVATFRWKGAC